MRRDVLYLKDALVHTKRALSYVDGCDADSLLVDPMRFDAIVRNLQIIGESVKQIPDEVRNLQPHIPWSKIAGIRNILVHQYFLLDDEIIVDICLNHLGPLHEALLSMASRFPELDFHLGDVPPNPQT